MKWLINVHSEEPHGQKKPHVDINAQSMSTDSTADRSTLGGQKQVKDKFSEVKPDYKQMRFTYLC